MQTAYHPFTIGQRFLIRPDGISSIDRSRQHLIMERGAFGSGEHETTTSCIETLETLMLPKQLKVLDLGSGTGILSIATLLLNKTAQVWCVDIEADAVASCERNCRLNGVNDRVHHLCGTLDALKENDFDLILANIYGDILIDVAEDLAAKAKTDSLLLLSGILWEYNFDVRKAYEKQGCTVARNRLLGDFSTVLLQK